VRDLVFPAVRRRAAGEDARAFLNLPFAVRGWARALALAAVWARDFALTAVFLATRDGDRERDEARRAGMVTGGTKGYGGLCFVRFCEKVTTSVEQTMAGHDVCGSKTS
jgi:hypothetical protein